MRFQSKSYPLSFSHLIHYQVGIDHQIQVGNITKKLNHFAIYFLIFKS